MSEALRGLFSVHNVHERSLPRSTGEVGPLFDKLSSSEEVLWPTPCWPRMKFDSPLGFGARGGHGPIRYTVSEYLPAQKIVFEFCKPKGFLGFHALEVVPIGQNETLLRHTIKMKLHGLARFSWPILYRPLHDALVEDAFTRAEISLGVAPKRKPWSVWVRILRYLFSGGKAPQQQAMLFKSNLSIESS